MFRRLTGFIRTNPDTSTAAKSGAPQMNPPKQSIPVTVPVPGSQAGFQGDVTIAPVTDPAALENNPDARPQRIVLMGDSNAQMTSTASSSRSATT